MEWTSMLYSVAASTLASTVILALIGFIARAWLVERIKGSIKHEYDDKLEKLRSSLKAQADQNLTNLKSEIDRQADKLKISAASMSDVQKATISKKVEAVDAVWLGFIQLSEAFPGALYLTDIFTDDEMKGFYSSPSMSRYSSEVPSLREGDFISTGFAAVQSFRPHLGEYAWAIYVTYRTIMGRSIYLLKAGQTDESRIDWFNDLNIQNLVASAFGKAAMEEFATLGHGRYSWLNHNFSTILLTAIDTILTGQSFSEAALQHAQRMELQILASSKSA